MSLGSKKALDVIMKEKMKIKMDLDDATKKLNNTKMKSIKLEEENNTLLEECSTLQSESENLKKILDQKTIELNKANETLNDFKNKFKDKDLIHISESNVHQSIDQRDNYIDSLENIIEQMKLISESTKTDPLNPENKILTLQKEDLELIDNLKLQYDKAQKNFHRKKHKNSNDTNSLDHDPDDDQQFGNNLSETDIIENFNISNKDKKGFEIQKLKQIIAKMKRKLKLNEPSRHVKYNNIMKDLNQNEKIRKQYPSLNQQYNYRPLHFRIFNLNESILSDPEVLVKYTWFDDYNCCDS